MAPEQSQAFEPLARLRTLCKVWGEEGWVGGDGGLKIGSGEREAAR